MMAQKCPRSPDHLFLTLAPHVEDGVTKLVEYHPPPPKESIIPEIQTVNAFSERVGENPLTSSKHRRSPKARRRKQLPRGDKQLSSTRGPGEEDRRIYVERSFPEEAEKLDANRSPIPITVVPPIDSPEIPGEPVSIANVSITEHLAMIASSTDAPGILANEVLNSIGEQSPHHENHDLLGSVDAMDHNQTPQQQSGQGSSNRLAFGATEATWSWSSSDTHALHVHRPPGLSQPTGSTPTVSCDHFFEILSILQRCRSCGCGSMIDVSKVAPTSQHPLSNFPLGSGSADPYLTGPAAPTAGYHFPSVLNGLASWDQNHDELFNFSSMSTSHAPSGSTNSGQLMDLGTTDQIRQYEAAGSLRLSITDTMQYYRDQPSAISASASSPASSMLQPTPASATAQDLPSPLWNFDEFTQLRSD